MISEKSISNNLTHLISIPPESNECFVIKEILDTHSKAILISNNTIDIKQSFHTAKDVLYNKLYLSCKTIIIYNIYPFDKNDGFIIEILLQELNNNFNVFYILRYFNFTDLSKWLVNADMINVKSTLQIEIKSYQESKNDFLFDYKLNFKILPFIIDKTIIICSTCKSAISTIDYIFKNDTRLKNTKLNLNFDDEKIKNYVEKGLGYLHGKLTENDKSKIIDLYNEGSIIILATTIQLKNVKCNNLIVKNTKKYSSTGYTDYNLKEIIDFMHYVNENGSVYLLTTNKCYNFYDNIFKKMKI